jgi:regulatory protein
MRQAPVELDPDADPESVARAIGLRLLERSPRTRSELATAMARKGVPHDIADHVLNRFVEVGLLNDVAFAEAWVESRHRGKGLARRALASELRRRGVDEEIAVEALGSVSNDDETIAAVALIRRRLPAMSRFPRDVQIRRLTAMLGRKGFGGSMAYAVVRQVLEEGRDAIDEQVMTP